VGVGELLRLGRCGDSLAVVVGVLASFVGQFEPAVGDRVERGDVFVEPARECGRLTATA